MQAKAMLETDLDRIKELANEKEAENQAFVSKQHEDAIAHIQNSNLTDAAKKEKIAQLKNDWAKADAKHAEEKAKRQVEHKAKSGK